MNALADVRLPAALARFADRRRAWSLLEPLLPQIIGIAGSIVRLEIANTHFKSYLKPSSRYKFYFAAVYRLAVRNDQEVAAAEVLIYLKAYVAGRSASEYVRYVASGGPAPVHLPELDALVWRFPHTPGLPQLADFFTAEGLRSMLIEPIDASSVEVVNFRPEQRCTLRVQSAADRPGWYAKSYADDRGRETFLRTSHLTQLAEQGLIDLKIPRAKAYDAPRRTLWLEEARGRPLEAQLFGERWQGPIRSLGRGLAQLHRFAEAGAGAIVWAPALLIEALRHKCERLVAAYPVAAQIMPGLLQDLQRTVGFLPAWPQATIHGDFHIGQLLAQDDQVVFCDLDELACGNPAQDLANLPVDLWLRGHARERIAAVEAVMLAAYCAEAGQEIGPTQLQWYALIALANRAYRTHLQQPEGVDQRILRILDEIERVRGLLRHESASAGIAEAA